MIFQDPMTSLNPVLTIGRQITETLALHMGCTEREARRQAIDLLEKVGIPAADRRIDDYPHQFSGGMRQRVMIAMALACRPAAPHRRRADHGAGRHDPGADPGAPPRAVRPDRDGRSCSSRTTSVSSPACAGACSSCTRGASSRALPSRTSSRGRATPTRTDCSTRRPASTGPPQKLRADRRHAALAPQSTPALPVRPALYVGRRAVLARGAAEHQRRERSTAPPASDAASSSGEGATGGAVAAGRESQRPFHRVERLRRRAQARGAAGRGRCQLLHREGRGARARR